MLTILKLKCLTVTRDINAFPRGKKESLEKVQSLCKYQVPINSAYQELGEAFQMPQKCIKVFEKPVPP